MRGQGGGTALVELFAGGTIGVAFGVAALSLSDGRGWTAAFFGLLGAGLTVLICVSR